MNPPMIHPARVPRKQRRVVVTAASTRPRVADPLPRHENRPRRDCSRDQPGSMPSGYKPMIGFDWLRIRGVDTTPHGTAVSRSFNGVFAGRRG